MHIPDGYLGPYTYIEFWIIMIPIWYYAGKKLTTELKSKQVPRLALSAAFSFVLMMFNVPVPRGSTGHAVGGGIIAIVIGPNGSGKTTLFRLLLGIQQLIRGNIQIFNTLPKRGNPHIGFVPQRHLIDPEMNIEVLELVRLGFSGNKWGFNPFSKKDRKCAFDALKAVGAEDLAHRSLGVLSGGELQRIFLAEALVSDPYLLLLDEPLSNLDIRREQELVQLIDNVVRACNATALLIAHNINPLIHVRDKVIYIVNGKVAIGKPNEGVP